MFRDYNLDIRGAHGPELLLLPVGFSVDKEIL